jgi:potassium-transporting ATPase KdpC subunit
MKTHLIPALRLSGVCLLVFVGGYSMLVWGFARLTTHSSPLTTHQIGQAFTQDKYFQSRPSAVGYNGGGSGGSNKGPSNPDYLAQVQARIDTFLVHNPSVRKSDIPSDLVTASGSGLDPHISPEGAFVQVSRIAKTRNLDEAKVKALVEKSVQQPLLGLFGTKTVHVLELNISLDKLSIN